MVGYLDFADRVAQSAMAALAPRLRTAMQAAIETYVTSQVCHLFSAERRFASLLCDFLSMCMYVRMFIPCTGYVLVCMSPCMSECNETNCFDH